MRALLAHGPGVDTRDLRHWLLGSGLDCDAEDIVAWDHLAVRIGQQDADLMVAWMDGAAEPQWRCVEQAKMLTAAPLMVVGDTSLEARAARAGAARVVAPQQVREGLDEMASDVASKTAARRGKVISVFAPTAGSGGTTVAGNLASSLQAAHPDRVGLIELAAEVGDLALLLDADPQVTAADVCQRWKVLDTVSLRHSFAKHRSGLWTLVSSPEAANNAHLTPEAARRIAVLARLVMDYTVLALDSRLTDCELEAMRLSDEVALVVRPDIPSVKRAHWAVLRAVEQGVPQERFKLVINRYGARGQLPRQDIERSLGLVTVARIPDDPATVNRAANRGELVREISGTRRISRRFGALARSLNGRAT